MLLLSGTQYAVWLTSILAEGWLFAILISRKRKFPAFTTYIGFCVVRSLILFGLACYERESAYFYTYYAGIIVEAAILAAVCGEVTIRVFSPWLSIPLSSKRLFTYTFVAFVVLTFLAVLLAPNHPFAIVAVRRGFERGIAIITFGWFSALAILSTYLHLPWRRHCYGIGTGFLLNLSVQSVTLTMISGFGYVVGIYLRYLLMFGFLIAEVAWIAYLWKPEPQLRPVTKSELERIYQFISTVEDVLNTKRLLKEIPQRDGLTLKLFPPEKNGSSMGANKMRKVGAGE